MIALQPAPIRHPLAGDTLVTPTYARWFRDVHDAVAEFESGLGSLCVPVTRSGQNDVPAFQTAVDRAAEIGGWVYVPPVDATTPYRLTSGTVTVPTGVAILGRSTHATVHNTATYADTQRALGQGSLLHITTPDPPFRYASGNHFQGLTFYYPDQRSTQVTPTVYPATFSPDPGAPYPSTTNDWVGCQFINCYQWIDADLDHLDFHFIDLVGASLDHAIMNNGCGGTDIFSHIKTSYFYWCDQTEAICVWIQSNAIGVEIQGMDALMMDACFFGSMYIGVKLAPGTIGGAPSEVNGWIGNLHGDGCEYTVYSTGTHPIGVGMTNVWSNARTVDLLMAGTEASTFLVSNASFWGAGPRGIYMTGTGGHSLRAVNIKAAAKTTAAIDIDGANCALTIADSVFESSNTLDLRVTSAPTAMLLSNNQFSQAPTITTPATAYRYRGNFYLADATVGA